MGVPWCYSASPLATDLRPITALVSPGRSAAHGLLSWELPSQTPEAARRCPRTHAQC